MEEALSWLRNVTGNDNAKPVVTFMGGAHFEHMHFADEPENVFVKNFQCIVNILYDMRHEVTF